MNVSSVGGAASLPVPLPPPAHPAVPAGVPDGIPGAVSDGAVFAGSAPGGRTSRAGRLDRAEPGELRLPGQRPATREAASVAEAEKHKEKPKPAPLPPLPGLTVAEFRAMLGVVNPQGAPAVAAQPSSSTAVQAAVNRYV